ncbi:hypothetical protein [Paraburkholderia pallida]|nr:hypothetical protein [Paraburkholderia pallida]
MQMLDGTGSAPGGAAWGYGVTMCNPDPEALDTRRAVPQKW